MYLSLIHNKKPFYSLSVNKCKLFQRLKKYFSVVSMAFGLIWASKTSLKYVFDLEALR